MVDNSTVTIIGTIPPSAVAAPSRPEADPGLRRRNLEALAARGITLNESLGGRADRPPLQQSPPVGPGSAAAGAGAMVPAAADPMKPLVVAGIMPLERTMAMVRASPPQADGFSRRFVLIDDDAVALVDELGRTDATALLADPRVELFLGPGCLDRFRDWLLNDHRQHTALPAQVVSAGPAAHPLTARVQTLIAQASAAQAALHESLRARVLSAYAGRTREYWADRFSGGHPLRVLIPVSRYSTFVRHSALDLATALRNAGHQAEVLTEPDTHSRLTTPAYLHAFDTFQPDLVVLINYTRRHMAQAIPAAVPVVCWVQDRMPHLFDAAVGAAQGELDFLMGHLHPELCSHFNYPRARRLFAFVPACPQRFSPPFALFSEKRDEVGYVSHQSETPERMHARLRPMFASSPQVLATLDLLYASASRWLAAAEAEPMTGVLVRDEMVKEALAGAGLRAPDERLVLTIVGNYLMPMLERMTRHRTLVWASRACARLGLRLRLFGRGWEHHPELSAYAAGELPHDERALPDTYHRCLAHLHVSLNSNAHQRVYECALSGGLMLRRGPSPDAPLTKSVLIRAAAIKPPVSATAEGVPVYECSEADGVNPSAYYALRGLPPVIADSGCLAGQVVFRKPLTDAQRRAVIDDAPRFPFAAMPDVGFAHARDTLFHSQAELEAMLQRATRDPAWRESVVTAHRAAAMEHCTYDRLTSDMLSLLRGSLSASRS